MSRRGARAVHLALFGLGLVLYVVFVLPRWWVLTGDIPRGLATAGRIAAGIPIALAALPVLQLLKGGLRATPRPPELALRLRAWSSVLHVIAGALILLAAIAEIWLRLQVGGPWLFGVYGAAAAIAVLAFLALYLSFVAEQPPAAPKPLKVKDKAKSVRQEKRPSTKHGRKTVTPASEAAEAAETEEPAEATNTDAEETTGADSDKSELVADEAEPAAVPPSPRPLRNKRPAGKSRRRP